MRQLRLLTTVLFCLCFIAETDAQTPDDSEDVVTVRIDSIIYPRIKMKEEEEQISRSDTVYAYMYNIYYHYYKNGEKTWLTNNVLGNDGSSADEVRFDVSDSDFTGYMTFDDVMRGLRYVVADANKRYGIRKRFQIWVNTLDFGEESVELCRIYDKKRHKIRHDFSLFKKNDSNTTNFVRHIYKANIFPVKIHNIECHVAHISANGFLRSQIRIMLKACFEYSLAKISLLDLQRQISNTISIHDAICIRELAPPNGLYLSRVIYK